MRYPCRSHSCVRTPAGGDVFSSDKTQGKPAQTNQHRQMSIGKSAQANQHRQIRTFSSVSYTVYCTPLSISHRPPVTPSQKVDLRFKKSTSDHKPVSKSELATQKVDVLGRDFSRKEHWLQFQWLQLNRGRHRPPVSAYLISPF